MPVNLKGRSFLTLMDFTAEEIRYLLDLSHDLKSKKRAGILGKTLRGKHVVLLFEKTSTRTRCAFETAIHDEGGLMDSIMELANIKKKYDQIASAYDDVQQTGYGIVMPTLEELTLQEPEIIKQSGKYGIRLKASAPSIHLMKTQITTEVTPIVGSEQQSEELVSYLLNEFEEDPTKIWESNIFGKSLNELVNEGLHNKLYRMPEDARMKLKETIERIINDGCNGLICIII